MATPKTGESKQDFLRRCTVEREAEGLTREQAFSACGLSWDASQKQEMAVFSVPVLLAAGDDNPAGEAKKTGPREFYMEAYTGAVVDRGWYRLIIDMAGIETNQKLPALRQHNPLEIVGSISRAWVDGGFKVSGQFSAVTEAGKEVLALADEGFPWQASIGVSPKTILEVAAGTTYQVNGQIVTGPVDVWTRSTVREVSFVALGADGNTAAISMSHEPASLAGNPKEEVSRMEKLSLEMLTAEAPALLGEIRATAKAEGLSEGQNQERSRVLEILELIQSGAKPDILLSAIKDGVQPLAAYKAFAKSVAELKDKTLEQMGATAPKGIGTAPPKDDAPKAPATFEDKVKEAMAADMKLTKGEAIIRAAREYPELWEKEGR